MKNILAAVIITLVLPTAAFAGGYAIVSQNPRDVGLSQSTTADGEGPGVALTNFAALARQEGLQILLAGQIIDNRTTWSAPGLGSTHTLTHPVFPPNLSASYSGTLYGMRYGAGIGLEIWGGGSLFWPGLNSGWPGAVEVRNVDQRVYLSRAGVALEVVPGVRLGGGLVYYRVTETLAQDLNFISTVGSGQLGLAGNAFSYALSAEVNCPVIPLSFGVDYRHKGDLSLSGSAHFENVPPPFQTSLQDQSVTEQVTVPNELFVGAAYRFPLGFKAFAAWSFENWVSYKEDDFVGSKGFSAVVPRDYRNSWVYRFGVEDKPVFAPNLALRVGVQRSVSPQPSDTISPTLSDASSWGFAVGAGYQIIPALRADAAYEFVKLDPVSASAPAFPGRYNTDVHFVVVGLTYSHPGF